MPPFILTPISIFLLLLLLNIGTNSYAKHMNHSSLVLSLTHSRSLHPSSKTLEVSELPNAIDMIEPLRGYRDGYLFSLNLGTPPKILQVYMDTGSDLTWVPCGNISFDCMECDEYRNYNKLVDTFSPYQSSSCTRVLCTNPLCTDVHSSDNPYDPCAVAGCSISTLVRGNCPRPCPSFSYTYGAGGVVIGSLSRDTLRVHGVDPKVSTEVPSFCFGCVGSSFREPIGIAGFGKGSLSLTSQLGFLNKGFSHCFLGFKFANNPSVTSPLVVGDLAISSKESFQFTPMMNSPMYPNYYYIGLEAIDVGNDTTIEAPTILRGFDPEGNGGMLIDTGTTYTHLPEPLFSLLLSSLSSKITYERSKEYEERTGFDLCYEILCSNDSCSDDIPIMTFYFLNNVKLTLPKENCFYPMSAPKNSMVVKCLLFQCMDDEDYGPAGIFGSFQQQNVEVVYDLAKERIGFQLVDCASSATFYGLH
ncbi:probable aspartyl protease At4g16563 [Typha latifolia]|uniref:probable aspartyl protease At4g16563 n=1 Tax=Typha latifolia TaxID=4733 RepID=UPI003C305595